MTILVIASFIATLTHAARSATERGEQKAAGAGLGVRHPESHVAPRSVTPCADARRAVRWYQARARFWAHKMGAARQRGSDSAAWMASSCPQLHRAVRFWRAKAHAWRLRYERWYAYEWHAWLPAKFYRVARCETGVDWRFDSGTYVSAFGIIRVAFPSWNGRNTPREQYRVAASIQRRYSWSAWGCGGA